MHETNAVGTRSARNPCPIRKPNTAASSLLNTCCSVMLGTIEFLKIGQALVRHSGQEFEPGQPREPRRQPPHELFSPRGHCLQPQGRAKRAKPLRLDEPGPP